MRIRQLVRKINKSLGENPNEWRQISPLTAVLFNSRGITVDYAQVCLQNRWTGDIERFILNNKEVNYISLNISKLVKYPSEAKIGQINKRRGWLVREITKTI